MKIQTKSGKLIDAWLEVISERYGSTVVMSTLREPTEEEVSGLEATPCRHGSQPTQLIFDEPGFMYDFRYCAICGVFLGGI